MKVFITGATGFLGKRVLAEVLQDPEIEQVYVVSRSKLSHPDARVKIIPGDLSDPRTLDGSEMVELKPDAVIHLAGLYNFEQPYSEVYLNNVSAMANLISWIRKLKTTPRVLYASTYAVGLGDWKTKTHEEEVSVLPSSQNAYAHCKALAEQALCRSGLPAFIFRLGVLVGGSSDGHFDKIDGPYYLMRFLHSVKQLGKIPVPGFFPLPADPRAILPFVPVDFAAEAFYSALFMPTSVGATIYGVYNGGSVLMEEFGPDVVSRSLPRARVGFYPGFPRAILAYQYSITGIPPQVFDFSNIPLSLTNPRFEDEFAECRIPIFGSYRDAFFSGFADFMSAGVSV